MLGPSCTTQLATHLAVVGVCPRVVALRMRRARQQLLRIRTHSVRVCHLKRRLCQRRDLTTRTEQVIRVQYCEEMSRWPMSALNVNALQDQAGGLHGPRCLRNH